MIFPSGSVQTFDFGTFTIDVYMREDSANPTHQIGVIVDHTCDHEEGEYWPTAYAGGGWLTWDITLNYPPHLGGIVRVRDLS